MLFRKAPYFFRLSAFGGWPGKAREKKEKQGSFELIKAKQATDASKHQQLGQHTLCTRVRKGQSGFCAPVGWLRKPVVGQCLLVVGLRLRASSQRPNPRNPLKSV